MSFGYQDRVLKVDLTDGSTALEELSSDFKRNYVGGRGFNMKRLYERVPPEIDPLSADNVFFVSVGPLTGTSFPGAARVNFSAKSPQTGILGDSNTGGFFGPELKFAGYDQLVIEGQAPRPVYLYIKDDRVELRPAEDLLEKDALERQSHLMEELDDGRLQVAAIGPAANNGVKFSGIFCNQVRAAARTGMGLVMASKNLQAIAVRGTKGVRVKRPKEFGELIEGLDKEIREHPEYEDRLMMGTTKLISQLNEAGCLATRHFQTGRFEDADRVSGEYLAENYKKKNKGCFSCTIPCSRFLEIESGKYEGLKTEGPEFEGLAGFSSRVGVNDVKATLKGVDLCNRYGMDVISTSECISFSMELYERGILTKEDVDGLELSWGNEGAILELAEKIGRREGFGDLLADGVRSAAERIGGEAQRYAMHVKGLEVFQADPRGIKAYALGFAVASRGGDHLRSEPSFEFKEDPEEGQERFGVPESAFRLEYKGKGKVVNFHEKRSAFADSLEVCKNTISNMEILSYAEGAKLLNALTGMDFSAAELERSMERIVNLERAYIVREGVRRADDTLPRRFLEEPLPEECGPSAGSVVELAPMLDEYYEEHGWDKETGIPKAEKLRSLGLENVLADLKSRGILD